MIHMWYFHFNHHHHHANSDCESHLYLSFLHAPLASNHNLAPTHLHCVNIVLDLDKIRTSGVPKKRTFSIALRVLPLGPMSKPIKFRPGWSSWNAKKKWKNIWFNNLTLTIMSRSQPPHLHLTDSRSRPVGSWLCPWSWLSAHCSPVVSCNRDWSSEQFTWSARFPINFNFPTSISTIASCRDFSNSALFLKERKVRLLFLI